MAWQYDTCMKLVRLVKRLLPAVRIVIGGYHATLMYEEIAASPEAGLIDFIVRGEGEEAFRRLINALDGKDRLRGHPVPVLSRRRRVRAQPARRSAGPFQAQAAHPRPAAADLAAITS